mmetsp:Transcript_23763/g.36064  ORF Transcript_23763/g.36064 Transcript_23763/m.36064 type:complete len:83 (+) Transcript_23763:997-1245(+)
MVAVGLEDGSCDDGAKEGDEVGAGERVGGRVNPRQKSGAARPNRTVREQISNINHDWALEIRGWTPGSSDCPQPLRVLIIPT